MTAILNIGTGESSSADFTVADGATAKLVLIDTDGGRVQAGAYVNIENKVGAVYAPFQCLSASRPTTVISRAGTYRVTRLSHSVSVGVDKE